MLKILLTFIVFFVVLQIVRETRDSSVPSEPTTTTLATPSPTVTETFDLNTMPFITTRFVYDIKDNIRLPPSMAIKEIDLPKLQFIYPQNGRFEGIPISLQYFGHELGKQKVEGNSVIVTVDMDKYNKYKIEPLGNYSGRPPINPAMLRIEYKQNDGSNIVGEIIVLYDSRVNNPIFELTRFNYGLFGNPNDLLYGSR